MSVLILIGSVQVDLVTDIGRHFAYLVVLLLGQGVVIRVVELVLAHRRVKQVWS